LPVLLLAICLALLLPPVDAASAADSPAPSEVWLVTYGPGEIYWQRFGHNAIWIRDPQRGLDHVFNFGFFDFAQENFLLRFLQGRMLYFSAARPAREEFAAYIDENRSIRAQRLALSGPQKLQLADYLLHEVRPENRDYRYDYYLNNCSTRVRDALDQALGGALSFQFGRLSGEQSWRDHTRRLTSMDFWLYLGLEIALGAPVDRSVNAWEEMFIPALLAAAVADLDVAGASGPVPLTVEDIMLFESSLPEPPAAPRAWWPRYLLASLVALAVLTLASRLTGTGLARGLARMWLLTAGLAGLTLLYFWLGTDHAVARTNLNLLVLNPLWLWPALSRKPAAHALSLVVGCSALALLLPFVPPHQYTFDVLAALLPFNLAAAMTLHVPRRIDAARAAG
jgi:hypothetical protein